MTLQKILTKFVLERFSMNCYLVARAELKSGLGTERERCRTNLQDEKSSRG